MTRKLLFLNGIAIIFAVYHHSIYWATTAINFWGHRFVSYATPKLLAEPNLFSLFLRTSDQIAGVAVPAFLFVSGFLYGFSLNNQTIQQSYRFIQKRIVYLLIPYIIWSTITVIFRAMEGGSYSLSQLVRVYLLGEANGPFYYVPLLIQLIIISPLLLKAIKKYPVAVIIISFLLQILSTITWYFKILKVTPSLQFEFLNIFKSSYIFSHLLWFIIGMVLFVQREKITKFFEKYRWRLLFLLLILLFLGQIEFQILSNISGNNWLNIQSSIIVKWFYSFLILAFVIFSKKIFDSSKIEFIGTKSYGIYLSHIIIIEICARLIYHLLPFILGQTIIFLGILVISGISIPLAMMLISKKLPLKQLYSYAWG